MIDIENPNRMTKKSVKAKDIDINAKVELSRRERYVQCAGFANKSYRVNFTEKNWRNKNQLKPTKRSIRLGRQRRHD